MKKYNLGFFPTPLHKLNNLSAKYSRHKLYIKRDDNTGLALGGNKTRKLEYLIKDAIDKGCDTVITAGAQQSNHYRQTAAACAIAKLDCHLLIGGHKPAVYTGNLLLSKFLGASIHFTGENRKGEDIEILADELESKGSRPYIIPYGGSNIIGAMGYMEAVKELQDQLVSDHLKIDYIFFPSSSGGTQAGLILGKTLYHLDSELMPVSIDKNETNGLELEEAVLNIVNQGKDFLNIKRSFDLEDTVLIKGYNEAGYGVITGNEREAIDELAVNEGIILDPVYTARAFYGMTDYIRKELLKPDTNVLFWHTGGAPANFYYADQLQ